jgi:hypothetical protein
VTKPASSPRPTPSAHPSTSATGVHR